MPLLEAAAPTILDRSSCTYTACYCEENVYRLVETLAAPPHSTHLRDLFVCFVSNPHQKVPLWEQRAGNDASEGFIVWDYHVILLQHTCDDEQRTAVWDLDTRLPFPTPFRKYCHLALRPGLVAQYLPPDMHRRYRIVPAEDYLHHFASDRSHMLAADGSWNAVPPSYPCITAAAVGGALHTLPQYLDMNVSDGTTSTDNVGQGRSGFGKVLLEQEFVAHFGGAGVACSSLGD